MFRILLAGMAVAVSFAGTAAAQQIPTVTLSPGEAVTVRFDDGGRAGPPERSTASWTPVDVFAAQHMSGQRPPEAPVSTATGMQTSQDIEPPPIPPSEVRMRFFSIAGRHALLVVENGRDMALTYRARMTTSDGETKATDVCVVLPRYPSYEHWPHTVERLELSNFRFIPWREGRAPTCR
jgi:hypothetical protein